ncbi:DUF1852 domain-containing protein [Neokomagataea tanensis]|uniref:DUF1852 domain-containing protein n=2 Tax=Neokomagataea TaxID=1223423 RepID=A0A4Y6V5R2_9PROT|nr:MULTISPECIES: putative oxygenase MesX [Neokomagataea]QDH25462.1 DUF1852 domain-containing protein [Neokomagataea tanensis]
MSEKLTFSLKKLSFNEDYKPSDSTRATTNFANLARGERRKENLQNVFRMINNRFNNLADWDNPKGDRYSVEVEIVSVGLNITGVETSFPIIEILKNNIIDKKNNLRIEGIVGNNFSSYIRDYDFSVLLLDHNKDKSDFSIPEGYGDLHGNLFKSFLSSDIYNDNFKKSPVICLSVSSNKIYERTENVHPILGYEYRNDDQSLTDIYFGKMGLKVRYFMPKGCVAPLAFYFSGDLLNDYTNLELIGTISTMEAFQKIYRPEIYNANASAGTTYQPSLGQKDFSFTQVVYDREERSRLAVEQGRFAGEKLIGLHFDLLTEWSNNFSA